MGIVPLAPGSVRHGRYVSENLPSSSVWRPYRAVVGCGQQFGEQVKVDKIAIQTAPCGNGWQVLGCIHSFVIIGEYSVERPLSGSFVIRSHPQNAQLNHSVCRSLGACPRTRV